MGALPRQYSYRQVNDNLSHNCHYFQEDDL